MGSIVALLVQSFQMQNQVIINSFDLIKSTRSKSVSIAVGKSALLHLGWSFPGCPFWAVQSGLLFLLIALCELSLLG